MRQLIHPNSCIRLITCENGYFAVDDVALVYAMSVQRLTLNCDEKGGNIERVFSKSSNAIR